MTHDTRPLATLTNGGSSNLESVPTLTMEDFTDSIRDGVAASQRVAALFGVPTQDENLTQLHVVLADDVDNRLYLARTEVHGDQFPSLTPSCAQVHLFEREIAEQFGLKPAGHPWLKPVRYHHSGIGRDAWKRAADQPILSGVGEFFRVEGEEIHEVAVGPVHAGIIEPGHFRFQCYGERVFHLEIALGYQHRGVEQALIGGPHKRSVFHAETLSGDTTIAHATSYCQVVEALTHTQASARAQTLRAIALELERLANHIGDLGALSGDVGFLPTASFCGRIRGDALNITALLCGSRFGRGMIRPGGVGFDVDDGRVAELARRVDTLAKDSAVAINLLWDTPSVMARFEDTGPLRRSAAVELGIVGPAARAAGLSRDIRRDQPSGLFRYVQIPVSTFETGDVFARAYIRWLEIQQSIQFIRDQLRSMPGGDARVSVGPLSPNSIAVALNEGWRGEVCHVAVTGEDGHFHRYKVVDPSFHNWIGVAYALRNQEISDFPLCNKSFNLSYCGHDL